MHRPRSAARSMPRALAKIVPIPVGVSPQTVPGLPIQGTLKFTVYFVGGIANPGAPIPILRYEELILLRAEAEIGTGAVAAAVTDLNFVRENSGNLPPYSGATTPAALITELMYERRYSLLWEQGTRWNDARRFGVLDTLTPAGQVHGFEPDRPESMPIPPPSATPGICRRRAESMGTSERTRDQGSDNAQKEHRGPACSRSRLALFCP